MKFLGSVTSGARAIVRGPCALLVAVLLCSLMPALSRAAPAQRAMTRSASPVRSLSGTTTPALQDPRVVRLGATPASQPILLTLGLLGRDPAGLQQFLALVNQPGSPLYRHYLTPAQYADRFGPALATLAAVRTYLRQNGLTPLASYTNGQLLAVRTTVGQAERAFHVAIGNYRAPSGRTFYAASQDPTLPAGVAGLITSIGGLDNAVPIPRFVPPIAPPSAHTNRLARAFTGPASKTGAFTPDQLRRAYDVAPLIAAGFDGSGRAIDLIEFDGFTQTNVNAFDTYYGIGAPAPSVVPIAGVTPPTPDCCYDEESEVELDIEAVQAIAPKAQVKVYAYADKNFPSEFFAGYATLTQAMATNDDAAVSSTSWGICERDWTAGPRQQVATAIGQMAAEGHDFVAITQDQGSQDCGYTSSSNTYTALGADYPGADPNATAIGGTALTLNAKDGYGAETVWNSSASCCANTHFSGTGGGISTLFTRPSYQSGPGVINSYSDGTHRTIPDLSADSAPNDRNAGCGPGYYDIYTYTQQYGTGWYCYGGTSAAAPLMAALLELTDEYAVAHGHITGNGFANAAFYTLAAGTPPLPPFHDITTGDNDTSVPKHTPIKYPATLHYDLASGLGSPDAFNLACDLAGGCVAPAFVVTVPGAAGGGSLAFSGALASFADAKPGLAAADYAATIDWGDHSTSGATISGSNGSFSVSGSHTYAAGGGYTVTVAVSDYNARSAVGSGTLGAGTPRSATVPVHSGWNLITLPLVATGAISASTVLAAVLQSGHGHLTALYALNGGAWSQPFIAHSGGATSGTDFVLRPGRGYLLYTDQNGNASETGFVPVAAATWAVGAGWTLVGLPQGGGTPQASAALTQLLHSTGGALTAIYRLSNGAWSQPLIERSGGGTSGTDFALQPGQGYLLYSDRAAATFTVPG
jgi:kumamolisin